MFRFPIMDCSWKKRYGRVFPTFLKTLPEESKVGFHMSRGQSSRVFLRWGWSVPGCPALDGHPDVNFKDWETIHQIWLRRRNDLWLEVVDGRAGIGVPAHLSTDLVVWPMWRSFKWNDDPNQPNTMSHLQCLISTKLFIKRRFGCVQSLDSRQTERSMPPTEWLLCGLHGLMPLSGIHIWHLIDYCLFCCEVNWIITTWVNWFGFQPEWLWEKQEKTQGLGLPPWRTKATPSEAGAPGNLAENTLKPKENTMAPLNFFEYGKSYGRRLYGKTPSKYLRIKLNPFVQLPNITSLSRMKHAKDLFAE